MTYIFYSPIIPHAIPLALVSSFLVYWIVKYSMLRRYKMPEMFSSLMATFFSNFMPWIMLAWGISIIFFYLRTADTWDLGQRQVTAGYQKLFSQEAKYGMYAAAGIAVLCIVAPVRSFINRRINQNSALEGEKGYKDLALTFGTDYDKENPLTIKAGQLRLL